MPMRRQGCVVLVVLLPVLAGCASSRPPAPDPGVSEARNARWAVLPLATPDTVAGGYRRESQHDGIARSVPALLEAAGQSYRLVGNPAGGDVLRVKDVYRQRPVEASMGPGLAPRTAAFDSLQAVSGCRYVLTIHTVRWSKMPSRIAAEMGLSALSAVASVAARHRDLFVLPTTPSTEVVLGLALVDVRRREVVARRTIDSSTADIDQILASALTELFTGRFLSPASFGVRTSDDVLVYRYAQPEIVGSGFRVEGLEAVVEMRDGPSRHLPVHTVSKVKSTTRNRTIFPVQR